MTEMDYKARRDKKYRMAWREGRRYSVPAEPIRQRLLAAGINSTEINRATGLSSSAAWDILTGKRTRLRLSTAQLLEGVTKEASRSLVPRVGTIRRIRALQRMGWSSAELTPAIGVKMSSLLIDNPLMTKRLADKVAEVYDDLSMKTGPNARTRSIATRAGWPPPLAWDDETIDDPNAVPDPGKESGRRNFLLEEIEFMRDGGASWSDIGRRFRIRQDHLARQVRRWRQQGRTEMVYQTERVIKND
jgi:hypothetical protein